MARSLDRLRVLTPCPLATTFNEPVSHCQVCGRDVLDLSALTREEAAAVLSTTTPPCVRFVLNQGRPVFATRRSRSRPLPWPQPTASPSA
jgi:hypothetical protein